MKRLFALTFILILIFVACPDDNTAPVLDPPTLVAPANGATIIQNPPTFVWNKVNENQIVYRMEVATDSLFATGTVWISTGPIVPPETTYTPDTVFAAGAYFWHACVRQDC
jgi:hypothetical protein